MTNDDLNKFRDVVRDVVKEEIDSALKPIKKTLSSHTQILDQHTKILTKHDEKLDALWEQTAKLSVDVTEIKDSLHDHESVSTKGNTDIKKIDKRVTILEDHLGLPVLPELAY